MVLPARIETMSVCGPRSAFTGAAASSSICGLMREDERHRARPAGVGGLSAMPRPAQKRVISSEGRGSRTVTPGGSHADGEPALQHGAAHLARADEDEGGGKC